MNHPSLSPSLSARSRLVFSHAVGLPMFGLALLGACSSSSGSPLAEAGAEAPTCDVVGGPASGPVDDHCAGQTPQSVSQASCMPALDAAVGDDGGAAGDAGADGGASQPLPCGEDGAFGTTMYGTAGDDDDCKYHVSYQVGGICENEGVYFVITATYLTRNEAPLTGAATFVEVCLNDTHVPPAIDSIPPQGKQTVVESPPGTYTVGPIQFDAPGKWTVRVHFNETCYDIFDDSPHGHAAFFVNVP